MTTNTPQLRGRLDLLRNLVRAELTARYKTTTLGVLWFVLNPLLTMLIMVVVFKKLIRLDIPNYPVFVLSALLPWTFFQMGLVNASSSIPRSSGLVKRVRIPRMLIPLAAVLASLAHFLISLTVLFLLMIITGVPVTMTVLWLPVLIVVELAFIIGAGLLTASLNVFYRDIEYLLDPLLRVGFYLTPSFYPLSYVPPAWLHWYLLNPMAGIVESYRETLVSGVLPGPRVVGSALITSLVTLVVGIVVFRRAEPYFDDYV